jgi:MIP family channel proteins
MQKTWDIGLDEISSPATLKAAFAEFVATALLVFIGIGAVAVAAAGGGILGVALAFGLAYALLVAATIGISGGHINPAVSFAMLVTGRITIMRGVLYVAAQLIGAVVGMLLLHAFLIDELIDSTGAGGNLINDQVVTSSMSAMGLEAVGTFILVWTVFAVAVTPRGNSGAIAPLFIGLAVLVVHLVLVPLTGAGINPARTFGPALVNGEWDDHWVFWVGPLVGAAIAGISYYVLYLWEDERPAPVTTTSV